MNISAKTEYACMAMLELAVQHGSDQPQPLKEIAARHGIPSRFLVQIFLQLKNAGLVTSVRGASGGYQLSGDPEDISLGDVMRAVDGPAREVSSSCRETDVCRALMNVWQRMAASQQSELENTTLSDLVASARGQAEAMYYI